MSEEIKEIISQLKEILNRYPDKQLEILLYVFGRNNLMEIINEPTYEELLEENQQLKDELETSKQYEDYYKDLCDKALKTGGKYISVTKEIREYIVNDIQHCTYGEVPKYQDLLQILDKVGSNDNKE